MYKRVGEIQFTMDACRVRCQAVTHIVNRVKNIGQVMDAEVADRPMMVGVRVLNLVATEMVYCMDDSVQRIMGSMAAWDMCVEIVDGMAEDRRD